MTWSHRDRLSKIKISPIFILRLFWSYFSLFRVNFCFSVWSIPHCLLDFFTWVSQNFFVFSPNRTLRLCECHHTFLLSFFLFPPLSTKVLEHTELSFLLFPITHREFPICGGLCSRDMDYTWISVLYWFKMLTTLVCSCQRGSCQKSQKWLIYLIKTEMPWRFVDSCRKLRVGNTSIALSLQTKWCMHFHSYRH